MNIILAMVPAFFWGTTYAVTKFTLPDWPPLLLGALRALPAGLLLLAIKPMFPGRGNWRPLMIIGLINIAVFFGLIFVMALTLPSAISGVGMISVPVFAMVFSWLFYRTRPSLIQAVCGGVLILLAWMLFDPESMLLSPIGMIAMLAAITCIIIGSNLTKVLGGKTHWWCILTWQLIIGGLALAVAAGLHYLHNPGPYLSAVHGFGWKNGAGLLWNALLNTALGYGLYVWLLQRMSVVDFTFGGIANPIAGIVCGGVLLGESFSPFQYSLMGGMILMSLLPQVIFVLRNRKKKPLVTAVTES